MSTKYPFHLRVVRSDGRELEFGDGTEWVLSMNGMDDWLDLDYTVSTSANVLTDGSSVYDKRVEEKDRTVEAVYWGRDRVGVRDQVIAFFNAKYSFEAHLTYFDRTRWCEGEQIGFDMPIVDERTPPSIKWTILSPDPYLRDENIHDEAMTDASAMFTFPFICFYPNLDRPSGCVASFRVYDGLNTVYNSGGLPASFRIYCEFTEPITDPTFHINDKFVKVVDQFDTGDNLVIDFMSTPPAVLINGANAIQKCTRDSVFVGMVLGIGSNTFWYEAKTGDINTMKVSIVHYDRYMGV